MELSHAENAERAEFFDAIYCGDREYIRQELARGVSANVVHHGESALSYAASHGQDDVVEMLLTCGADPNLLPMIEAALPKDTTVLKRFLAMGGDSNAADDRGHTPLMEAANWGNTETVRLLLEHGADPLVGVDGNGTALDAAHSGKSIDNPSGDYGGVIALLEAAMAMASASSAGKPRPEQEERRTHER